MIETSSRLWQYLSPDMQALLRDGEFLVEDSTRHNTPPLASSGAPPTDFSYIVFPFAKLYEGFLKKLFLDAGIISQRDYRSDHFRIGKVLSPNLARRLGARSAYAQISNRYGNELAAHLWHAWKEGRNLVFHYFPHNFRRLTRDQAIELINTLTNTMTESIEILRVPLATK